jgi:hypothetical protein
MLGKRIATSVAWIVFTSIILWFIFRETGLMDNIGLYIFIVTVVIIMKAIMVIYNKKKL